MATALVSGLVPLGCRALLAFAPVFAAALTSCAARDEAGVHAEAGRRSGANAILVDASVHPAHPVADAVASIPLVAFRVPGDRAFASAADGRAAWAADLGPGDVQPSGTFDLDGDGELRAPLLRDPHPELPVEPSVVIRRSDPSWGTVRAGASRQRLEIA